MLIKIKDFCNITMGQSPESKYYSKDTGVPFIQGNRTFGLKYPYIDTYTEKVTKIAPLGSVLMSVRAPVGDLNIANQDICIGRGIAALEAKDKYNEFLFYALKSNMNNILNKGNGTTYDSITIDTLKEIEINIPDEIIIRKKISNLLASIDYQIERNNNMVKKLQVLAHSIYSSWFIQFNFPNAEGKSYKSSGGKMIYNEEIKRDIPEGWEVKKLKDLMFKVNRPFNYSKDEKTIDLSVMPSNSFCLADINSSKNFSTNLFSMKKGDLLFGSIRPYLKKAGLAPCDGAVAGTVHCLNVYNEFDYNFCLLTLCSENVFDYANKASKGTKMPVISCDDLLEYPIIYCKEIIQKFQSLNLKEFIPHLIEENHRLTSLKNKLLPLLINGQLQ